jgi:hypothetical protein
MESAPPKARAPVFHQVTPGHSGVTMACLRAFMRCVMNDADACCACCVVGFPDKVLLDVARCRPATLRAARG